MSEILHSSESRTAEALALAATANTAANLAAATAQAAETNANAANATATEAKTTAESAASAATTAKTIATTAKTTAESAQAEATAAKATAADALAVASEKYTKPTDGIPNTDLSSAVQTSLEKADTALQTLPAHVHATTDISASTADNGKVLKVVDGSAQWATGGGGGSGTVSSFANVGGQSATISEAGEADLGNFFGTGNTVLNSTIKATVPILTQSSSDPEVYELGFVVGSTAIENLDPATSSVADVINALQGNN